MIPKVITRNWKMLGAGTGTLTGALLTILTYIFREYLGFDPESPEDAQFIGAVGFILTFVLSQVVTWWFPTNEPPDQVSHPTRKYK